MKTKKFSDWLNESNGLDYKNADYTDSKYIGDLIMQIKLRDKSVKLKRIINKPFFNDKWNKVWVEDDRALFKMKIPSDNPVGQGEFKLHFRLDKTDFGRNEKVYFVATISYCDWNGENCYEQDSQAPDAKFIMPSDVKTREGEYPIELVKDVNKFFVKLNKNTGIDLKMDDRGFKSNK